jgi:hypothetical protein
MRALLVVFVNKRIKRACCWRTFAPTGFVVAERFD